MEKEKQHQLKKLNRLIDHLDILGKTEDFECCLEENDIDLQELIWACSYHLKEYRKNLEKEGD